MTTERRTLSAQRSFSFFNDLLGQSVSKPERERERERERENEEEEEGKGGGGKKRKAKGAVDILELLCIC